MGLNLLAFRKGKFSVDAVDAVDKEEECLESSAVTLLEPLSDDEDGGGGVIERFRFFIALDLPVELRSLFCLLLC